jgi:hypothetical protein
MKNFSDLPDTDPTVLVVIKLSVIGDNGFPGASIRVNQEVIDYLRLLESVEHVFEVPLNDTIEIEISMIDKLYSQDKKIFSSNIFINNMKIKKK